MGVTHKGIETSNTITLKNIGHKQAAHVKCGYKSTEIGEIPIDWDLLPLGNFIALQRGHDLTEQERRKGDVPVMGSAGQNGFHDTEVIPKFRTRQ